MALEIKGLQRVFKFRKGSSEIELADPDDSLSPNEVMDFYSMTYPELTTASVHGPECEDDSVVYRFKTTIGTERVDIWQREFPSKKRRIHAKRYQNHKWRDWPY